MFIAAEATHDGEVLAEAEGLFIALPPEQFGLPPDLDEVRAEVGETPARGTGGVPPTGAA